jgi:hypothetical protein
MADDQLIPGVSTDGFTVAECVLAPGDLGKLPALIDEARRSGADRLWVHSSADRSATGFGPEEGSEWCETAAG